MPYSVRHSLAWMGVSQAGLVVMQFVTTVLVTRLLTPYDMGVFAVASAIVGVISIMRSLGLTNYIIRAKELDEKLLSSVFTVNAIIATVIALVIAACGAGGGLLLNEAGVTRVLLLLSVVPLINIFELLPGTSIERSGDFRTAAVVGLIRGFTSYAVTLVLAFDGFSYMSLAYGHVAGTFIAMALVNIIARQHVRVKVGLHDWRAILRYGFQVVAISGVNVFSVRFADVVLGRIAGLAALGLYSRAAGFNALLWDNVHLIVGRIVFVDFAAQLRRGESLRNSYLLIVQFVTGLLWPAFAGIAVISGPLIFVLYGPAWAEAAVPLSLLAMSSFILVTVTMAGELFVVREQTAQQARFEFIRAAIGICLFTAGCFIGFNYAAAARLVEALFAACLYFPYIGRMTDTSGRDYGPIYRASLALTAVAIAPAVGTMTWYGWSPAAPFGVVSAAVAAGIVSWMVLLLLLRHPLAIEAQSLVSQVVRKMRRGDARG